MKLQWQAGRVGHTQLQTNHSVLGICLAIIVVPLSACGASDNSNRAGDQTDVVIDESREGMLVLESKVDGVGISFEFFEPDTVVVG